MEENKGQILLYQTPDGEARIEVRLEGETVWLNLDQMAELFQRNKSTYNLDMIISVGYRVHSYRGVQFRMWATRVLKEYKSNARQKKETISFVLLSTFRNFAPK